MRRTIVAIGLGLCMLTLWVPPAGAGTASYDDPTGDAPDHRGDLVKVSVTYSEDHQVTVAAATAQFEALTSKGWRGGGTHVVWAIHDPNGKVYSASLGATEDGKPEGAILDDQGKETCEAPAVADPGQPLPYSVSFVSVCVGDPEWIEIQGAIFYDAGDNKTVFDEAPDGKQAKCCKVRPSR